MQGAAKTLMRRITGRMSDIGQKLMALRNIKAAKVLFDKSQAKPEILKGLSTSQLKLDKSQLVYLPTKCPAGIKNSLQRQKFKEGHDKALSDVLHGNSGIIFAGHVKPRHKDENQDESQKKEQKIFLYNIGHSEETLKNFFSFFLENCPEYEEVVIKKLKKMGLDVKKDDLYKIYLQDKDTKGVGTFAAILHTESDDGFVYQLAGFSATLPFPDKKHANLGAYLLEDFRGLGIGTLMQYTTMTEALREDLTVVGIIESHNIGCQRSFNEAIKCLKIMKVADKSTVISRPPDDYTQTYVYPKRGNTMADYVMLVIGEKLKKINRDNLDKINEQKQDKDPAKH